MNIITDPMSDPAFLRGLIDVIAVAIIAGVVGTFIVLRGIGFLGDALAHAIFPGVVTAFLVGGNLLVGALVAGLTTAAIMGLLTANARVRDNTSIGVIFTAAFALGVVILTNKAIEKRHKAIVLARKFLRRRDLEGDAVADASRSRSAAGDLDRGRVIVEAGEL